MPRVFWSKWPPLDQAFICDVSTRDLIWLLPEPGITKVNYSHERVDCRVAGAEVQWVMNFVLGGWVDCAFWLCILLMSREQSTCALHARQGESLWSKQNRWTRVMPNYAPPSPLPQPPTLSWTLRVVRHVETCCYDSLSPHPHPPPVPPPPTLLSLYSNPQFFAWFWLLAMAWVQSTILLLTGSLRVHLAYTDSISSKTFSSEDLRTTFWCSPRVITRSHKRLWSIPEKELTSLTMRSS